MFLNYFQKNASQHSGASNAPGQSFNCGACALSLTGARLVCFDCDKVVGGCLLLLVPVEGRGRVCAALSTTKTMHLFAPLVSWGALPLKANFFKSLSLEYMSIQGKLGKKNNMQLCV